jgi:diguanylate cyclase (GGDEF)-like protein
LLLPELTKSHVHPIIRARFFAAAIVCALAALISVPSAAGADPIVLDGFGFGLTGTLGSPLGQPLQSQLPPVGVGPTPEVSLPQLSVTTPQPAGGVPGSPAQQPASSPLGQGASRPSGNTPGPGTRTDLGLDRGATGRSRRASSRRFETAGNSARAGGGGVSSPARRASGGTRRTAGQGGRHQPSIVTRIVTRIVDRVPAEYRIGLLALAAVAVLFGLLSLHESRRSRRAREDALADSLTGLANREGLEQRLEAEWRRALRYERDLGLLLLDLDGFKEINDTQGHMAGDRVLREAAAAISGRIRETDFASRFGGDEFVVLCPETGDGGLKALADGLEETLRRHRIGASAGFTQREPSDSSPRDLLARADAAMYRRKRESSGHTGALAAAEA